MYAKKEWFTREDKTYDIFCKVLTFDKDLYYYNGADLVQPDGRSGWVVGSGDGAG